MYQWLYDENLYQSSFNLQNLFTEHENSDEVQFLSRIVDFVFAAHLNKTTTNSLLSLLRLNCSLTLDQIPKTIDSLWKQLDISFTFEKFYFCSKCFVELAKFQDSCPSCDSNQKANSELCIFPLVDEVKRVVQSNIYLIEWYSLYKNKIAADIVNGKLSSNIVKNIEDDLLLLGKIYRRNNKEGPRLTLLLSIDGKTIIKSKTTQTSLWPVSYSFTNPFLCFINVLYSTDNVVFG